MSVREPIAITGVGCLCGAGLDLRSCIGGIFSGRRSPTAPVNITSDHGGRYPVFEVTEPIPGPSPRSPLEITRTSRLAFAAACQAMADAGHTPKTLRAARVGVCIGTTVGAATNVEQFYRDLQTGHPEMGPVERFLRSNPAEVVARELDLDGPLQTVVNACSSGSDAIGLGADWIRSGICDIVIAGGADELCRVTYNGFISLMICDDMPCRPFDRDRKGLNLGEGAGMLVLESNRVRQQRAKRAQGFVLGYGSSCDAYHLTAPRPDGKGLKSAISQALQESGTSVTDIAFINAHGTGTLDNDRLEMQVIRDTFPGIPFLSTKGHTGHTLGAAGALEAAFTVVCLALGRIPPSIGFANPEPGVFAMPVAEEMTVSGGVAVSQSLAFGGTNAVLVLGVGDR